MVTSGFLNAHCMLAGVSLKLAVDFGQTITNRKIPLYILISITCKELLSVC
jgi:hypothetical protein